MIFLISLKSQILDAKEIEDEIEILTYQLSSVSDDSFENDPSNNENAFIQEFESWTPYENYRILKLYEVDAIEILKEEILIPCDFKFRIENAK